MDLKIEMDIKLPYILRLAEAKDYQFSLEISRTEYFILDLRHNNENDEDIYEEYLDNNICKFIYVELILKNIDVHPLNSSIYFKSKDEKDAYTYTFANEDKIKIFNKIHIILNKILSYLRKETNMFWIDEIKSFPITYSNNMHIKYQLYSPNAYLSKSFKMRTSEYIDYTNSSSIIPITDFIFDNFNEQNESQLYEIFLDRAQTALSTRNYSEFFIYGAIVIDSYIKHFFTIHKRPFNREEKRKYEEIKSVTPQLYVDKNYNKLLKLLTGKSLLEIDSTVYNNLCKIYKLRNDLMHEGHISEKTLKLQGIDTLNFNTCSNFLAQIYKMIEILENIY